MKKVLFIGCGSILVLVLGMLGFLSYVYVGPFTDMFGIFERAGTRMAALDVTYPYAAESAAALDADRFGRHLDLRVTINNHLVAFDEEIERLQNDPDQSLVSELRAPLAPLAELPGALIDMFDTARMGSIEFAYYSRVLWAAMRELDKGTGSDRFNPVRARYAELKHNYERDAHDFEDAPGFDEIIGAATDFSPETIDTALHVMGTDLQRLMEGIRVMAIETIAMQLHRFDSEEEMPAFFMHLGEDNSGIFR